MRQLNNKQFDTKEGASASLSELSHPQLAPSVSQKDEIMQLEIRNSTFEVLFDHILQYEFPNNWDCFETDDQSINPLVIFKVEYKSDWKKLLKLCKSFVKNSNDVFCLERGAIQGFIYLYEMTVKGGK
tara:strand:- start:369 stop:752 length:384 start_codon:yes stop_codon:yes gene_type:complete